MRYTREDGCRAWLSYGEIQPVPMAQLLEDFGSAEAAYDAFVKKGPQAFKAYATDGQLKFLSEKTTRDAMHEMMLVMQRLEMGILTPEDEAYPEALRNIPDPPFQLFYRGDPACLRGRCVTVVGSRNASRTGEEATYRIDRELSENGVCIVSGLAVGIDSASLRGGLDGGTPVAGILGCGLDVDYPASNGRLKERILEGGGVLMSEYPPGVQPLRHHFPIRNRIMSGLSSAVLMMESSLRSGSLITVQHALDQGREVYAYPGEPGTAWAEGAHRLLREGANYFASAQDVLEDMGWLPEAPATQPEKKESTQRLTSSQQKLYELLKRGEMSYDELAAASGLDPSSLSGALTMLQLMGFIIALPGKVYKTA